MQSLPPRRALGVAAVASCLVLTACPSDPDPLPDGGSLPQTLFVAHEGALVSYDLATGDERPGTVIDIAGPTDMQALADGTLVVNLTNSNRVLAVDGLTMLERTRIPSSGASATRPVHSLVSPLRNGHQYWLTLNDGESGDATTDSALFLSLDPADYLGVKGEIGLGVGHHKATFSSTRERMVISNIADCDLVLGVYDYAGDVQLQKVIGWSAEQLGWDGSSFARTCDPTFQAGVPPSPHGCATSKLSGKAYCNLTGSGELVAITLDAAAPEATRISTTGSGAGYTAVSDDGRYIYSLQEKPREGAGGVTCQIGQLVTLDAQSDSVVSTTPLLYRGPGCTTAINGTDEETAEPSHILLTHDGAKMYVTLAGGFGLASARVRQELVLDLTDPAHPVQRASIPIGTSSGHHGDTLSGDGRWLIVTNGLDGTVSVIDTTTDAVTRTLTVKSNPRVVATFGTTEGPSHQTGPIH